VVKGQMASCIAIRREQLPALESQGCVKYIMRVTRSESHFSLVPGQPVFVSCLYNGPTLQSPQSHLGRATQPVGTQPTTSKCSLLWIHRRIYPAFQTMPSSESSSLAGPTLGRHRFCRESVTPRRIQRYRYALVPIRAFDPIISLG
jgi:hypothetical protein